MAKAFVKDAEELKVVTCALGFAPKEEIQKTSSDVGFDHRLPKKKKKGIRAKVGVPT